VRCGAGERAFEFFLAVDAGVAALAFEGLAAGGRDGFVADGAEGLVVAADHLGEGGPVGGRAAGAGEAAAVRGEGVVAQLLFAGSGEVGEVGHVGAQAVRTGRVAAQARTRPVGVTVARQSRR